MVDMIADYLRAASAVLGLLASTDPVPAGSVMVVVVAFAAALIVLATVAARTRAPAHGSGVHPTRRIELSAPLAQSDPDAAGHVRRRGPGQAATAA